MMSHLHVSSLNHLKRNVDIWLKLKTNSLLMQCTYWILQIRVLDWLLCVFLCNSARWLWWSKWCADLLRKLHHLQELRWPARYPLPNPTQKGECFGGHAAEVVLLDRNYISYICSKALSQLKWWCFHVSSLPQTLETTKTSDLMTTSFDKNIITHEMWFSLSVL